MERGRLAERQERISKPKLHHEPSDRLKSPFFRSRSEGPESKEHPGETDGRNANEKDKFSCHRTECATSIIVGGTFKNEGEPKNIQNDNVIFDQEERKSKQQLRAPRENG